MAELTDISLAEARRSSSPTNSVVVPSPVLDDHLGLLQSVKDSPLSNSSRSFELKLSQ